MYPLPKYAHVGLVQMSIKGNTNFSMQLKNEGRQLYLSKYLLYLQLRSPPLNKVS